jgi:hypothetical protein
MQSLWSVDARQYIGLTFQQEVEMLIRCLDNTPYDYKRTFNTLVFDDHAKAESNYVHVKHFVFACKWASPVLDRNTIIFTERYHAPIILSPSFSRKRERALDSFFRYQVGKIMRYMKGKYRCKQHGLVVKFEDINAIFDLNETLSTNTNPRDLLGLVRFRYVEDMAIEFYRLPDVPL